MTTYTKKAAFGFLFLSLGALGAGAAGYLLRLLLARQLGPEEYGLVYAVMALFGLVYAFQHLGMGAAISKFVSEFKVKEKYGKIIDTIATATLIVTVLSGVVAISGWFFSDWLAVNYFDLASSGRLVRIYSVAVLLMVVPTIIPSIFQGFQRMELISIFQFSQSVILLLVTGVLLYLGFGVYGALLAYSITFVFLLAVFFPIAYRLLPKQKHKMRIEWKFSKKMLLFGLPVTFSFMASLMMTQIDTVLLTFFQPLTEVGLYQTAVPTANIIMMFGTPVATILLPMGAELWARKEKELLRQALRETYVYISVLALPVILAMFTFPDIILNLLFGQEYIGAAVMLQLLAIAMLVSVLNLVNSSILSGIGKPGDYAKAVGYAAVFNLVANLILIPRYSGVGAAIATLSSIILIFILTISSLKKDVAFKMPFLRWGKMLIASAGFLLTLNFMRELLPLSVWPKIIISLALAMVIYSVILVLTKTLTVEEIKDLFARIMTKSS